MVPAARIAEERDLAALLALFAASEVSPAAKPVARAEAIWREIISHPGTAVFVSQHEERLVATATLITAPNLLRQGRRHAFLENVVSHPDVRGKGHGRAVVAAALAQAWALDCHRVLLQSGRGDQRVHRFYRDLGFVPDLRTAYVAQRPGSSAA